MAYIIRARTGQAWQHDDTVVEVVEIRGTYVTLAFSAPRWALEEIDARYLPDMPFLEVLAGLLDRDILASEHDIGLLTERERQVIVDFLAVHREAIARAWRQRVVERNAEAVVVEGKP